MNYCKSHSYIALECLMAGLRGINTDQMQDLCAQYSQPDERVKVFAGDFNFIKPVDASSFAVAMALLLRDAMDLYAVTPKARNDVAEYIFETAARIYTDVAEMIEDREREKLGVNVQPVLIDEAGKEIKIS